MEECGGKFQIKKNVDTKGGWKKTGWVEKKVVFWNVLGVNEGGKGSIQIWATASVW